MLLRATSTADVELNINRYLLEVKRYCNPCDNSLPGTAPILNRLGKPNEYTGLQTHYNMLLSFKTIYTHIYTYIYTCIQSVSVMCQLILRQKIKKKS